MEVYVGRQGISMTVEIRFGLSDVAFRAVAAVRQRSSRPLVPTDTPVIWAWRTRHSP